MCVCREIVGKGWFCPFQCAFHSYHRRLCKETNLYQSTVITGHTSGRRQHDNSRLLACLLHCFFHYTNPLLWSQCWYFKFKNHPIQISTSFMMYKALASFTVTAYSYVLAPRPIKYHFKAWPEDLMFHIEIK